MTEAKLNGRELAEDLARTLSNEKWMVWTQMPLGSVQMSNPGIVDVIAMSKSYNPVVKIYEVKASRSDYLVDIHSGKYMRYLTHCHYLYFATEAGLLKREDLPSGCGLITHSEKGWHTQTAGRRNNCSLSTEFLLALLMRGSQEYWGRMRRLDTEKDWWVYKGLSDAAAKFGKKFAQDIAHSQDYLKEARALQGKVDEALGKSHSSLDLSLWTLQGEVNRLLGKYKNAEAIVELTEVLKALFEGHTYGVENRLKEVIEKIKEKGGNNGST